MSFFFLIERSGTNPQLARHVWSSLLQDGQIKTHSFTETIDRRHKKNNSKCIAFFRSRVGGGVGWRPHDAPPRVLDACGKCFSGRLTGRRQRHHRQPFKELALRGSQNVLNQLERNRDGLILRVNYELMINRYIRLSYQLELTDLISFYTYALLTPFEYCFYLACFVKSKMSLLISDSADY